MIGQARPTRTPAPAVRACRPDGSGTTAIRIAIGSAPTAVPKMIACQATPASANRPTTSGEASAPTLKKRWARLRARPRPSGYRSRTSPFIPPSMPPPPRPSGIVAARKSSQVGTVASPASPSAMRVTAIGRTTRRPIRSVMNPPISEPATYATALTKKIDPDPGIGLAERRLDGPDERWDEQPGPADQQQPGAGEDGGVRRLPRGVEWHAADASGQPDDGRGETDPPRAGRACKVGAWHEPPSRPSPAASCSSSTARTRRPRAWSRTSPGSRTRSAPAAGTSRSSPPNGVAGPACVSGHGRRRSTGVAGRHRCRSRSCGPAFARMRS